jgi:ATP adenylyltransferase
MEHLWSPWRYDYVASVGTTPRTCPFCIGASTNEDAARLVVHRGTHNFVILNLFPYTVGHILIAPYAHIAKLDDASSEQMSEMMELVQRGILTLRKLYQPEGFNLGMNLGHCAGAGIREHLHMHVIPRWIGDANVISVVGETRVLSEELSVTYRRFVEAF